MMSEEIEKRDAEWLDMLESTANGLLFFAKQSRGEEVRDALAQVTVIVRMLDRIAKYDQFLTGQKAKVSADAARYYRTEIIKVYKTRLDELMDKEE